MKITVKEVLEREDFAHFGLRWSPIRRHKLEEGKNASLFTLLAGFAVDQEPVYTVLHEDIPLVKKALGRALTPEQELQYLDSQLAASTVREAELRSQIAEITEERDALSEKLHLAGSGYDDPTNDCGSKSDTGGEIY